MDALGQYESLRHEEQTEGALNSATFNSRTENSDSGWHCCSYANERIVLRDDARVDLAPGDVPRTGAVARRTTPELLTLRDGGHRTSHRRVNGATASRRVPVGRGTAISCSRLRFNPQ